MAEQKPTQELLGDVLLATIRIEALADAMAAVILSKGDSIHEPGPNTLVDLAHMVHDLAMEATTAGCELKSRSTAADAQGVGRLQ